MLLQLSNVTRVRNGAAPFCEVWSYEKHSGYFSFFLADKYDKYLLYKAGDGTLYGGRDFIFKSSKVACEIMVQMDGSDPDKVMANQPAFFDTTYEKVKDFLTCGMWCYHPGTASPSQPASLFFI